MFRGMTGLNLFGRDTRNQDGMAADPRDMNGSSNRQSSATTSGAGGGDTISGGGSNDNLSDDFAKFTEGLWEDKSQKDSGNNANQNANGNGNQQQQNQNGNQPPADNAANFQKYLNELGFHKVPQLTTEEVAKVQQGDFSPIMARMQQGLKGAYQQAMADAVRVVNESVDGAVERAVDKANVNRYSDEYVTKMFDKLPWAKEPGIAPLAKQAFSRFLKRDGNVDLAVENTRKYFHGLASKALGEEGDGGDNRGGNGSGGNRKENTDWMSVFGGA